MADPTPPRFRPPNFRLAAKRFAGLRAFLGGGRPELSDPNVEYPSAMERARAAYAAETGDVNLNFLRQFADVQPRDAANFIAGLVRSTAENPLAAVAPVPKGGMVAKEMQRRARLKAYDVTRREFDSARMRGVNEFLARQRSGFEANLEPPPTRSTPRREYVIEQSGPRVDVFDAIESAPEQITLEQARAAGVLGPETMPLPGTFHFTRTGPRVDVADKAAAPFKPIKMTRAADVKTAGSNFSLPGAPEGLRDATSVVIHRNTIPGEGQFRITGMRGGQPVGHYAFDSMDDVMELARKSGFAEEASSAATKSDVLHVERIPQNVRSVLGNKTEDFRTWIESGYRLEDDIWNWLKRNVGAGDSEVTRLTDALFESGALGK